MQFDSENNDVWLPSTLLNKFGRSSHVPLGSSRYGGTERNRGASQRIKGQEMYIVASTRRGGMGIDLFLDDTHNIFIGQLL